MNNVPPREKSVSLSTVPILLDVAAQWVACITGSEEFKLSINDGPEFTFFKGAFISLPTAEIFRVRISQKTGAGIDPHAITILYGIGEFRDARLALTTGSSISNSAVTLDGSTADVVLVAATNTLLLAAAAARRCARIRNTHATSSVRLSTVAADLTAGKGELLNPGEIVELFVTGAIYARSAGTPTLVVSQETY